MTRFIGIISGKGGVGKTTTSINLAAALSYFSKKAIVVDTNITTPNVGLHLGVPSVPVNLHHVLQGKDQIRHALYKHYSGLYFVPASLSLDDMFSVNINKLKKEVPKLGKSADFVLVDCAAGLGGEVLAGIDSADEFLVVTNPEKPALTDALKTISLLEKFNKKVLGVVVTRHKGSELDISLSSVEQLLGKKVVSVIPEDWSMREAMVEGDAVVNTHPRSRSAVAYKALAAKLLRKKYYETAKRDPLFKKFFLFLKRTR